MASAVRVPEITQTSDEVRLIAWLKHDGDPVTEGEPLYEAETDKAQLEVESAVSGTLLKRVAEAGESVRIGSVIAWIGAPGEEISEPGPSAPRVTAGQKLPESADRVAGSSPHFAAGESPGTEQIAATPAARAMARELSLDLAQVAGSGPGGRIERRDVLGATAGAVTQQPGADGVGVPVAAHRRAIATRLSGAAAVPQFTVRKAADARPALARVGRADGVTITHLLLRAMAGALRRVPQLNRIWLDDGPRVWHLDTFHVGLAIAGEDTLLVATIPEPDRLTMNELVRVTRTAVTEARGGRLSADFTARAAVTLSNLGMHGIDGFDAIVDPDQTAILAAGRLTERPVVTADGIVAMPQLDLSLTADHRTVDGIVAAKFLVAVCEELGS